MGDESKVTDETGIPNVFQDEPDAAQKQDSKSTNGVQIARDSNYNASYVESFGDKNESVYLTTEDLTNNKVELGDLVPVPPDGGYGWVVVIAAFCCNFVVDGIANSFSPFVEVYRKQFNASRAHVGFIGSCLIGTYLLVGPVVSGLVNKFGARMVIIVGGLLAGLAFLLSIQSSNVYMMIFLYGVVGGAGFGFIYLPAIVVVCFYFEKMRSVATGIAVAGSGVGTIIVPPLCFWLLEEYGWKITLVVLAGLVFACAFIGILYKPLIAEKHKERQAEKIGSRNVESRRSRSVLTDRHLRLPSVPEDDSSDSCLKADGPGSSAFTDPEDIKVIAKLRFKRMRLAVSESDSPLEQRGAGMTLAKGECTSSRFSVTEIGSLCRRHGMVSMRGTGSLASVTSSVSLKEFSNPMNRSDIFYQGSIKNLPKFVEKDRDFRRYRKSQVSVPTAVAAQGLELVSGKIGVDKEVLELAAKKGICSCLPLSIRTTFSEMVDISLLKEPAMILLSTSNVLAMLGFYVPLIYLPQAAEKKGIEKEDANWLLSVIGIFNTLGRVFFGWLADRGWLSALTLNNISLLSCGILTMLCPLITDYSMFAAYAGLYGFMISAYICLTSIVLTDLLGLNRLTNAFGVLVISRSVACFIGTPFAGGFYEATQSYDASFWFGGILILLGGLSSCLIPCFETRWKKPILEEEGRCERMDDANDVKDGSLRRNPEELELGCNSAKRVSC